MRTFLLAALAVIFATLALNTAEAKRYTQDDTGSTPFWEDSSSSAAPAKRERQRSHSRRHHSDDDGDGNERGSRSVASEGHHGAGPRPGAWCGWFMRTRHGGGPDLNLAANWAHWGSPSGPQVGAIVVWPHHVGEITGRTESGQWIVLSGNDSHRVRERARSVSGAVFRMG